MRRFIKYIALFIAFLPLTSQSASTADQGGQRYDKEQVQKNVLYIGKKTFQALDSFLAKLEKGLKNDSPDQIAEVIYFPFNWNVSSKKTIVIKNKAQFKKLYKKIFNKEVKKIALNAKVEPMGSRGYMIGSGTIWFWPYPGIVGEVSDNLQGIFAISNEPYN